MLKRYYCDVFKQDVANLIYLNKSFFYNYKVTLRAPYYTCSLKKDHVGHVAATFIVACIN